MDLVLLNLVASVHYDHRKEAATKSESPRHAAYNAKKNHVTHVIHKICSKNSGSSYWANVHVSFRSKKLLSPGIYFEQVSNYSICVYR